MAEINVVIDAFTSEKGVKGTADQLQRIVDLTEKIQNNKSSIVAGANKDEIIKEVNAVERLVRAKDKQEKATKEQTKSSIIAKEEQKIRNNQLRQQAKLESILTSAYDKQSIRLNMLRKSYKDLAVQGKANTQQSKELLKEITKLDQTLKNIDDTVGQHQRHVGDYQRALGVLGGNFESIAEQAKGFGSSLMQLVKSPVALTIAGIAALGKVIYDTAINTQAEKDKIDALAAASKAYGSTLTNLTISSSKLSQAIYDLTLREKQLEDSRINSLVIQQELRVEAARAREAAAQDGVTNRQRIKYVEEFIEKTKAALETRELQEDVNIKEAILKQYGENSTREQNKQYQEALAALKKLDADLVDETLKTQKQILALKEREKERLRKIYEEISKIQEEQRNLNDDLNEKQQKEQEEEQEKTNQSILNFRKLQVLKTKEYSLDRLNADVDFAETERDLLLRNTQLTEDERQIIIKESEQKIQDIRREFISKQIDQIQQTSDFAFKKLQEDSDARTESLNNQISEQEIAIDRQQELADKGLNNTLAFEEKKKAELEKSAIDEQKRKEKIKKVETFFNLFAEYAKEDPRTALPNSVRDIALATAFSAAFAEDGGIVEDIAKPLKGGSIVNGIFNGRSHRNGGILLEAEGKEGIFSKKEMANLGRDNFYSLKELAKDPIDANLFERQNAALIRDIPIVYNNYNSDVIDKIDELKEVIKNQPHTDYKGLTKDMMLIFEKRVNGKKETTLFKPKKF